MGTSYNPRIVTAGLKSCVDFANRRVYTGSGTSFTDIISGDSGSLLNGASFDSSNSGGIILDGTNDEVEETVSYPNINSDNTGITMSIYLKAAIASPNSTIWIFSYSSTANDGYRIILRNGSLDFTYGGAVNHLFSDISESTVFNGQWRHVTCTSDNSNVKGYLDGKLLDTVSRAGAPSVSNSLTNVSIPHQRMWGGSVAGYSIYNRALSADEIRQNYLATKERYA